MAEYFYGNDLYSDLFLNNNREIYIKMLLLDINEPEIEEFYVRDIDYYAPNKTTSKIIAPYSPNIYTGDSLSFNAIEINLTKGTTVTLGSSFTTRALYTNISTTVTGNSGDNYLTVSNVAGILPGMYIGPLNQGQPYRKISAVIGSKIYFSPVLDYNHYNQNASFYSEENTYIYLDTTNFYIGDSDTLYQTDSADILNTGFGGTYYKCNKFNKIIVSNKEIQGVVTTGSLNVDGDSPMRRTIDFSCIVDREFGASTDLKLRDFDNKKIKVLIGIKDSTIGDYDYSSLFADNATQKDSNDIVWFKLGVFIPRNINIKHSVDSYLISVTAQDKMAAIDGSFGGILGTGIGFKEYGENTSFYETIESSFANYTKEPANKINISFADNFTVTKSSVPATNPTFIVKGFTHFYIKDISNIQVGMGVEGFGIFPGTKVTYVTTENGFGKIGIDYPAFKTVNPGDDTYYGNQRVFKGITFTYPSYKNFFGIQPLRFIDSTSNLFFKPTTINFKSSTSSYNIYTTISDWEPQTWGSVSVNQKRPVFQNSSAYQEFLITSAIQGEDKYTSNLGDLKTGDVISVDQDYSVYGLYSNSQYVVTNTYGANTFTLQNTFNNTPAFVSGGGSGLSIKAKRYPSNAYYITQNAVATRGNIAGKDGIKILKYNKYNSKLVSISSVGSGYNAGTDSYNSYTFYIDEYLMGAANTTYSTRLSYTTTDPKSIDAVAFNNSVIYTADNTRKIICGNTYGSGPKTITITGQVVTEGFVASTTDVAKLSVNSHIYIISTSNALPALVSGKVYRVKAITSSTSFTLKSLTSESSIPVSQTILAQSVEARASLSIYEFNNNLNIASMEIDPSGLLTVFTKENMDIVKYKIDSTTKILDPYKVYSNLPAHVWSNGKYDIMDGVIDSSGNMYFRYIENSAALTQLISKVDSNFNQIGLSTFDVSIHSIVFNIVKKEYPTYSIGSMNTYPNIRGMFLDENDNLYFAFSQSFIYNGTSHILKNNIALISKDDFSVLEVFGLAVNDSLIYFGGIPRIPAAGNGFFAERVALSAVSIGNILFENEKIVQFQSLNVKTANRINSIKELAPQTGNTIVKESSETVSSILEDVKSQLGVYQYYYDTDGNFIFSEDKRLSFYDPSFDKITPYDFTYENYNINVAGIPFEFDFIKNKNLITDYNNSFDLSTFKNDFFVYGTKKGLDFSESDVNSPMLYHIMIDDLSLKNSDGRHPWHQYFIDRAYAVDPNNFLPLNTGSTYADFIYIDEMNLNFPFINSRPFVSDSTIEYLPGEYLLVSNEVSNISASPYNLYRVTKGGTCTTGIYPIKQEKGEREYLNNQLTANGLTVQYEKSVNGQDYKKYQGIYSKIINYDNNYDAGYIFRKGDYFLLERAGIKFIYQVQYMKASGIATWEDDRPIYVSNISNYIGTSDTFLNGQLRMAQLYDNGTTIRLGGPASIEFYYQAIDIFDNKYYGIFRKSNTGTSADFDYDQKNGDPGSWGYYFDIVNIVGNYDNNGNPIQIQPWVASTYYPTGKLVYSDGKIYEAVKAGVSGNTAPTGFGDEDNLIRDTTYTEKLGVIWKLVQISVNFENLKVSAIGSRKNAVNDKDINILFAPKEALSYFETSGYYLFIINDYLNYDTYSEDFHYRFELLLKQFAIEYPQIKIIVVPQSQIDNRFYIDKLTTLKDAFSVIKKNFYLNFVNGQAINLSSVPIYNIEPLGIIRIADEISDLFGNFILTSYSLPLAHEGPMSIVGSKTHPYDDKQVIIPNTIFKNTDYNSGSQYADRNTADASGDKYYKP